MKQNQKSLSLFTIGETFQCFLKAQASQPTSSPALVEESDVVNYILQEMVNQNLAEATEDQKLAVDYALMYQIIETMALLGLAQRKTDTTCSQKFLSWTGLSKFRRKFDGVISLRRWFAVWPESGQLAQPEAMTREDMEAELKYKAGSPIERFVFELFFRMMRNEDRVLPKAEIDQIKAKYLLADCNNMEYEQRRSLFRVLKMVLIYSGILALHVRVLPANEGQKEPTQVKGLQWAFKAQKLEEHEFAPSQYEGIDQAYFSQRKTDFVIEFKKEPPRMVTQSFDNSGFAVFKGRNWRFFMQKLYCIIGRSPVNYKKKGKSLGMKVVWHVDVDLGHLRKVSRQHALLIYNFEEEHFEIKCLSRKYPVYVNRQPITFQDAPRPVYSGSIIAISSESFYFLLPPRPNQSVQSQLLQLQGGVLSYNSQVDAGAASFEKTDSKAEQVPPVPTAF